MFLDFVGSPARTEGPHGGCIVRVDGVNEIGMTAAHGLLNGSCYLARLVNETRKIGAVPIFYMDWNIFPMSADNMVEVDRAFSYLCGYVRPRRVRAAS